MGFEDTLGMEGVDFFFLNLKCQFSLFSQQGQLQVCCI